MRARDIIKFRRGEHFIRIKIWRLNIYLATHAMQMIRFEKKVREKRRRNLRGMALDRAGHRCEICGRGIDWKTMSLHHIKPRLFHPELEFDPDNVQALCAECHQLLHRTEMLTAKGVMPAFSGGQEEAVDITGQLQTKPI